MGAHSILRSPNPSVDGLADLEHGQGQPAPALPQSDLEDRSSHAPGILRDIVRVRRQGEACRPRSPDVRLQEDADLPRRLLQRRLYLKPPIYIQKGLWKGYPQKRGICDFSE